MSPREGMATCPVSRAAKSQLRMAGIPTIAGVAIGVANAWLALSVSTYFFAALPAYAFAVGFLSPSRVTGLVATSALLASYSLYIAFASMGNVVAIVASPLAFFWGGFLMVGTGYLAPTASRGWRSSQAKASVGLTAIALAWCLFLAMPRYGYYYQVIVEADQPVENLELLLPVGTVSGKPYLPLLEKPELSMPEGALALDVVDTEQGSMVRLRIARLERQLGGQYVANTFYMNRWRAPRTRTFLSPRSSEEAREELLSLQERFGVQVRERLLLSEFVVPVRARSETPASLRIRLENRTDKQAGILFTLSKSESYSEQARFTMESDADWESATVQTIKTTSLPRIMD